MGILYGLNGRSARRRFDQRCCAIGLHLHRGKCRCIAIGLTGDGLDLLLDGGAAAAPPVDDDSLWFFASAHAELLGRPSWTADLVPDRR